LGAGTLRVPDPNAGADSDVREHPLRPAAFLCANEALVMPTVWVEFQTREESERAIGRLEFAGFERERIDRIEAADGRCKVGIYVDERDAPSVRGIMSDPNAPISTDVLNSLLIFGVAAMAGFVLAYLIPRGFEGNNHGGSREGRSTVG